MIIPWAELLPRYGLKPKGCLHLGGHLGQEGARYAEYGISDVLWVEANPELIPRLRSVVEPLGQRVVEACVSDVAGERVTFHVTESANGTNEGQSSSVLDLEYHLIASPDVYVDHDLMMVTTTVDDLMVEHWPDAPDGICANLDLQGLELRVLKGAVETLEKCEFVYEELNCWPLYSGCGLLPEVEEFMMAHGFELVEVELAGCQFPDCRDLGNRAVGWGDGLFRRVPNPKPYREKRPDWWEAWFGEQDARTAAISKARARAAQRRSTPVRVRRAGR